MFELQAERVMGKRMRQEPSLNFSSMLIIKMKACADGIQMSCSIKQRKVPKGSVANMTGGICVMIFMKSGRRWYDVKV